MIVTVDAASVVQLLSDVLLTVNVYVPAASDAKLVVAWKPEPTLYSTPAWLSKTIVPVGVAQVGCVVDATVGTDGAPGAALIVTDVAAEIQVLSDVLLIVTDLAPADTPVNVALAW